VRASAGLRLGSAQALFVSAIHAIATIAAIGSSANDRVRANPITVYPNVLATCVA